MLPAHFRVPNSADMLFSMLAAVENFVGHQQREDDVALIVLHRLTVARAIDGTHMLPETDQIRRVPDHMNGIGYLPSMSTVGENRPTRVDDTLLIRAAQQGDAAAFEQLVQQYDRLVSSPRGFISRDRRRMVRTSIRKLSCALIHTCHVFVSSARFIPGSTAL